MYTNFLSFIRLITNRNEKNVFKKTQGQLARIFSGLLILFLAIFIVIVFSVLYLVILKTQERDLQTLVKQEAAYIENYLWENGKSSLQGIQNQEIVFAGAGQSFYYVVDSKGDLIMGNEADYRLHPNLLRMVSGKFQKMAEIRHVKLHVEGNPRGRGKPGEFRPSQEPQDVRLLTASQPIYVKGQLVGQLYIGKDISFAYQMFYMLLIVFAVLGFVFIGVALLISANMSKKAMVPISRAFTRQQEFTADASHELRTPLSVLLSSIDAMEMTMEPQRESFLDRILTNMRQEVKRMNHLVGDLLTLARSDSNAIELRAEQFDFRPLADKAIESAGALAASKQIILTLNAPETLKSIGDPHRLSQLLYILLDNAIKYTPNGGEVHLRLEKEGQGLRMIVEDTGIGIKKEDIPHIFERFYRADKSRTRQTEGHGLGLSIAKWIVETHCGTIKIDSELGKGSRFIIQIPQGIKLAG
ncbi:sensor histidine kinase [Neobacillus sp. GCM10023253]|uniref:sensor histidine kinase n=1 Tax=Neobacillus sp. GCM10023253 TaxID=3252644 RepID=UPI00361BF3D5